MKKLLAIIMCGLILSGTAFTLAGCGTAPSGVETPPISDDTSTDDTPEKVELTEGVAKKVSAQISRFSTTLFKEMYKSREEKKNTLVSPFSVYTALSLLSNGANNDTEAQISGVLSGFSDDNEFATVCNCLEGNHNFAECPLVTTGELNAYFEGYMRSLEHSNSTNEDTKLYMANSVWAFERENLNFNENFFNISRDYYNAELFSEEISDKTVKKINNWVEYNTDGMIEKIINDLTPDTVAVLINTLAFDGKWKRAYETSDVYTDKFTDYTGNQIDVEYMESDENYYIDMGNATGFIKDYSGSSEIQYENEFDDGGAVTEGKPRYGFVALLPDEGTTIDSYIDSMTNTTITDAVNNAKEALVFADMPKFEFSDGINFNEILSEMGMTNAFSPDNADFSSLATSSGNIYVSDVLHNTYISVAEEGTRAAAATAIIMMDNCADVLPEEYYEVKLDRPFVFAIYDYEAEAPIFIGTYIGVE